MRSFLILMERILINCFSVIYRLILEFYKKNQSQFLVEPINKLIFAPSKPDSVAQLVEQYTFNVWALGSNPSGITKKNMKPLDYQGVLLFKYPLG
jgi:hypothetical protein